MACLRRGPIFSRDFALRHTCVGFDSFLFSDKGRRALWIAMLFIYGAGIGAPLVLFGTSIGLISRVRSVARWWEIVHRGSGVILIGPGLYLLWKA